MADGDENTIEGKFSRFLGFGVSQAHTLDKAFGSEDFIHNKRREQFDFLVLFRAIDHDLRGAKFVATVNQVDFAGVTRKKVGLFHRGIAPAHHSDGLAAKKIPVARGASGNAVANQLALPF